MAMQSGAWLKEVLLLFAGGCSHHGSMPNLRVRPLGHSCSVVLKQVQLEDAAPKPSAQPAGLLQPNRDSNSQKTGPDSLGCIVIFTLQDIRFLVLCQILTACSWDRSISPLGALGSMWSCLLPDPAPLHGGW